MKQKFIQYFANESCKSCSSKLKADNCPDFDECSSMELEYFQAGFNAHKSESNTIINKLNSALKIIIDYPDCTLINSCGDTFTFNNNSRNEDLIDFLSSHEEGLKKLINNQTSP